MSNTQIDLDAKDAVPAGPFHEMPPLHLWRRIAAQHDGKSCLGDAVRASGQAWLTAILEAAGVELGDYDHEVIALLAQHECVSTVQVIGGWISRTRPMA